MVFFAYFGLRIFTLMHYSKHCGALILHMLLVEAASSLGGFLLSFHSFKSSNIYHGSICNVYAPSEQNRSP